MKTIVIKDVHSSEQALREGQSEEVVVFRDGKPVALVTPFDEDDLDWYARERDPQFVASIARAREQARRGDTLTHAELKRQLGVE